jgi:glycosyltransferase involved in cell wall biosynthesis
MNIWILAIGEPLPFDDGSPRLLRAGILATKLAEYGVDVTWWNSNFDHTQKVLRNFSACQSDVEMPYKLRLLKGIPYRSNVSIARIYNHRQVAADFARCAQNEIQPDLIFAAYPTIELCEAALAYARVRDIPVVLDIRDLWPDIFVNLAPHWAHWIARILLIPSTKASRRVCSGASAITGITEAFVNWGVRRANRHRHSWDQVYPLAYQAKLPSDLKMVEARAHWDNLGLRADIPIVCFFGTLGRQFDIPSLIDAARRLVNTPIQIVICGTGDLLGEYRQLAKGLSHIHFPGWVDAPAISALMERSLAGLAPYHNETSFTMSLPNKAIEYLAGGLPVVSTLKGELAQLLAVNDCGFTTPEGDSLALANALRVLHTDTLMREKMAKNARNLYRTKFQAEVVYGQLIRHLRLIAKQHSHGQKLAEQAKKANKIKSHG